ncbi:Mortality factor 4-like protein 2 [Nowakowskiella sp. JEL0407]|nr:Mortality factor 4-like protein 2 [Nowakowskiella sp. JEL0407]
MSFEFAENERVLCYHHNMIYEAKVLKLELREGNENPDDNGPFYFIHYKGWKARWDEWVSEKRVMKFNDENINKQNTLQRVSTADLQGSPAIDSTKKRKAALNTYDFLYAKKPRKPRKSTVNQRIELKLKYSENMERLIMLDWERSSSSKTQVLPLPRPISVAKIISNYLDVKFNIFTLTPFLLPLEMNELKKTVKEIMLGLVFYFNNALENILYQYEKSQYLNILKMYPGIKMCDIYGAEHLVRLLVVLPKYIANSPLDSDSVEALEFHLSDLLK